ncbi:MAG TPA: M48 family metalloprotease [Pyrinomonadaceae bacterium]|nr:M48 family metalloprotease [Pyrinomonadaceae bacterium]
MKSVARLRLLFTVVAAVLLLSALTLAIPQQDSTRTDWTPPSSRKAKTPFAPKPFGGDNIFRGEAEVWLADAIEKLEGGIFTPVDDRAVPDYVSQVGNYLVSHSVAPTKQYKFIVTTDWMPDAMTAGGGRIYISRGMLELLESEDELAGVLAHEIAHDAFSHAARTVTRQMFWMTGTRKVKTPAEVEAALEKLWTEYQKKPITAIGEKLLGFARFDELEADRAAFYNLYKAGYNPYALVTVLKRMAREDKQEMGQNQYYLYQFLVLLFGNHPPSAQRSMAISWESNFLKMPDRDSRHKSAAFDAMKLRIKSLPK